MTGKTSNCRKKRSSGNHRSAPSRSRGRWCALFDFCWDCLETGNALLRQTYGLQGKKYKYLLAPASRRPSVKCGRANIKPSPSTESYHHIPHPTAALQKAFVACGHHGECKVFAANISNIYHEIHREHSFITLETSRKYHWNIAPATHTAAPKLNSRCYMAPLVLRINRDQHCWQETRLSFILIASNST